MAEIFDTFDKLDKPNTTRAKCFDELKVDFAALPPEPVYETGVDFLDEALDGFTTGQLILVSGDPEAGKTMLGMQILKNVTKHHKALLFAFEFTTRSMVKLQLQTEGEGYQNPNLMVIDNGHDVSEVIKEVKYWRKQGVQVVLIDSQMRVENTFTKAITMEEREREKFSMIAKFAHRNDMIILFIIQNSKADTASGTIAPMGSKKGAHEANIIMHIKRIKEKDNDGKGRKEMRELHLVKNKQNGVHFKNEIIFNPYTKTFHKPGSLAATAEYTGHKKKKVAMVEHVDASGKITATHEYDGGQMDMPFIDDKN